MRSHAEFEITLCIFNRENVAELGTEMDKLILEHDQIFELSKMNQNHTDFKMSPFITNIYMVEPLVSLG